jgi:hypothetical protein
MRLLVAQVPVGEPVSVSPEHALDVLPEPVGASRRRAYRPDVIDGDSFVGRHPP